MRRFIRNLIRLLLIAGLLFSLNRILIRTGEGSLSLIVDAESGRIQNIKKGRLSVANIGLVTGSLRVVKVPQKGSFVFPCSVPLPGAASLGIEGLVQSYISVTYDLANPEKLGSIAEGNPAAARITSVSKDVLINAVNSIGSDITPGAYNDTVQSIIVSALDSVPGELKRFGISVKTVSFDTKPIIPRFDVYTESAAHWREMIRQRFEEERVSVVFEAGLKRSQAADQYQLIRLEGEAKLYQKHPEFMRLISIDKNTPLINMSGAVQNEAPPVGGKPIGREVDNLK